MVDDTVRKLLALAKRRLEATDDPYKREKLGDGIALGEEVLDFLSAIRPIVARQTEQMIVLWHEGGLFGGDDGRTHDESGLGSEG